MSAEWKVPLAAARYDTAVLIVADLCCSLSSEFIGLKLKSAEFLKLSVISPQMMIYMFSNRQAVHCFLEKLRESVLANFVLAPKAVIGEQLLSRCWQHL